MILELNRSKREDLLYLQSLDWEKVKSFYYVAELGSFVNASRFLNISQSALSRQVIYLESHLGCTLLSRHNSGVTLTKKGKELFAIAEITIIKLKDFTRTSHAKITKEKKRKIRITSTHAINAYILDTLIFAYNKEHPEILFELISEDYSLDIILNDIDIAIRPIDSRVRNIPKEQNVQQEYLFSLEKKLFASPKYLENYGEPCSIEDLKNHYLIGFSRAMEHPYSDANWILKLGMPEGQLREPIFSSNSIECGIEAAKRGIGIVSSYDEYELIRESNLKRILPNIKCKELKGYLIYPDYLKNDKEVMELKKYLQKELR